MLLSEWAYCFNLVVYVYWSRQLFYHINARKVLKYYCIIYKRFHIDKTDLELAGNIFLMATSTSADVPASAAFVLGTLVYFIH